MSNYKKIAEIGLTLLIILFLCKVFFSLIMVIAMQFQQFSHGSTIITASITLIFGVIIWSILKKRSFIVTKFFKTDSEDIDTEKSITYQQAFNLTCVLLGLFLLIQVIPGLFTYVYRAYVLNKAYLKASPDNPSTMFYRHMAYTFGYIAKLAIAIYLLYGAPHFARWQANKTKKLIEELE